LAIRQTQQLNADLDRRVLERTRELNESRERLERLTAQMKRVEEIGRERLAHLLHNHVQQLQVAAKLQIAVVASAIEEPHRSSLAKAVSILNDAMLATRDLAAELTPPLLHGEGLPAGLRWLISRANEQLGLRIRARIDHHANPDCEGAREILFQAAQEFLLNVAKHAGSDQVFLQLKRSKRGIHLRVCDRGRGFDATKCFNPAGSFGLVQLRKQVEAIGGALKIKTVPGNGTCATAITPALEIGVDNTSKRLQASDRMKSRFRVE
jgi:signal transduction histidine kinase